MKVTGVWCGSPQDSAAGSFGASSSVLASASAAGSSSKTSESVGSEMRTASLISISGMSMMSAFSTSTGMSGASNCTGAVTTGSASSGARSAGVTGATGGTGSSSSLSKTIMSSPASRRSTLALTCARSRSFCGAQSSGSGAMPRAARASQTRSSVFSGRRNQSALRTRTNFQPARSSTVWRSMSRRMASSSSRPEPSHSMAAARPRARTTMSRRQAPASWPASTR